MPLWLWARDKTIRIILVGNTDPYAEQIGRSVMTTIERTPRLSTSFGIRPGIKWAAAELHIERPNWQDRSPSLLCLGVGADVQSQRADYILGDDIFTRQNSATEQKRQKLSSYIETDLASRLDKSLRPVGKGKKIVFGHRVHANDGYEANMGRKESLYFEDRAIVDEAAQTILIPESGHTYEAFAAHRSRDPEGFELTHQQRSTAGGIYVTRVSMEACRDQNERFIQSMNGDIRTKYLKTWLSLDPAFSTNRWSSHAVFNLWGLRHDGKRQLLWAMRDRINPEHLLTLVEMKFRLFMPDHFFIEGNQAQVLLIPILRRKFPDHYSKFSAIYTTDNGKGSSNDLETSIQKMLEGYSCEPPQVVIPYATTLEQAYAHTMAEEYCGYPSFGRRDTMMAEYVGLKGMGLIKSEERKGYVMPQGGILGAVADRYRRRFTYGR